MYKLLLIVHYELRDYYALIASSLQRYFEICYYPLFRMSKDTNDKIDNYLEDLHNTIDNQAPDMIFFFCLTLTSAELNHIKSLHKNISFAYYDADGPTTWHVLDNDMPNKSKAFDIVFTNCKDSCKKFQKHGAKEAVFLFSAGDDNLELYEDDFYKADVSLYINLLHEHKYGQIIPRKTLIEMLTYDKGINFKLYGNPELKEMYPDSYVKNLSYEEIPLVYHNSKISINLHDTGNAYQYVNNKNNLILASRSLLLVDPVPGLDDLYDPESECMFLDVQAPLNQIHHILQNYKDYEDRIQKGWLKIKNKYNWNKWAEQVYFYFCKLNFNSNFYLKINNLESVEDPYEHWLNWGFEKKLKCVKYNIPETFQYKKYIKLNNIHYIDSIEEAWEHWREHGSKNGFIYPTKNKEINRDVVSGIYPITKYKLYLKLSTNYNINQLMNYFNYVVHCCPNLNLTKCLLEYYNDIDHVI